MLWQSTQTIEGIRLLYLPYSLLQLYALRYLFFSTLCWLLVIANSALATARTPTTAVCRLRAEEEHQQRKKSRIVMPGVKTASI